MDIRNFFDKPKKKVAETKGTKAKETDPPTSIASTSPKKATTAKTQPDIDCSKSRKKASSPLRKKNHPSSTLHKGSKKRVILDDSDDDDHEEPNHHSSVDQDMTLESKKKSNPSSKKALSDKSFKSSSPSRTAAPNRKKRSRDEDEEVYKPLADSDSDDDTVDMEVDDSSNESSKESENQAVSRKKRMTGLSNKTPSSSKKSASTSSSTAQEKPNAFSVLKSTTSSKVAKVASKAKPSTSTTGAAAVAASMESDEKILSKDATSTKWKENESLPYSVLCNTFAEIEAISGRLDIQKHMTMLLRLTLLKSPDDVLAAVYLASNSVAAAYECVELGIGDAILIKAIGEASGSNPSMIKKKYEAEGDLGDVSMKAKGKQRTLGFGVKPKPLSVKDVLTAFRQIATTSGAKSQKWKVDKIKGLLVRAQEGSEAKYLIRGLQGKLRIGLAQSTVLVSLSHAVLLSCPVNKNVKEKNDTKVNKDGVKNACSQVHNLKLNLETRLEQAVNIVKKAYSEVSSFDILVKSLLEGPLYQLHQSCTLRPGLPVEPMLAKPTKSIQEVLKRLNGKRFTCEYKYDGERAQIHMSPEGTKVFSRNLLDTSEKFPEVPLYVKEAADAADSSVTSFVLDTEVVAFNRETKQFVPFQVLSTRKKTEESEDNAKVKVIVQAFDLMYFNGESLLDRTLSERRDILKKNFKVIDGKFQFATSLDHKEDGDTTVLEEFLDKAVKNQCEGLMVKTLDENATYQPSYRSLNWLKLKKDYLEGMGDSVDLVPIGAYYGRGKRTGVYGAYLLACYDLDTEEYQSVCKIGTGFSDEDLKELSKGLNENVISSKSSQYVVSKSLECDVWFEACQCWEVKAADLSKSSSHKGAIDKTGESGRGIGLRFPRFERLRNDKKPEQATTSDQILEMYYAQDSVIGSGNADFDGI